MSPTLFAKLRRAEREAQREALSLFSYYRRDCKMGPRRARYYSERRAIYGDAASIVRFLGSAA